MMYWLAACADVEAVVDGETEAEPIVAPEPPPPHVEEPSPTTIRAAFPPPRGAERVDGGAYREWLLDLGVLAIDVPVTTFAGELTFGHDARVVDLPLVPGDLQQCSDSAARLRAEWQRSVGVSPRFHTERGEELPWARFQAGEMPHRVDGRLEWKPGSSGRWDDWLSDVFNRANTFKHDTVPADEPRPGDMIQRLGSPGGIGHLVVLIDVATRGSDVYVLVGEGFMPAQSFHIERGPYDGWFRYHDGELMPVYGILSGGTLRRWKD